MAREPHPPDLLYIVEFNDGVTMIATEAVGHIVVQTHPGARLFTYGIVAEVKVEKPKRRRRRKPVPKESNGT